MGRICSTASHSWISSNIGQEAGVKHKNEDMTQTSDTRPVTPNDWAEEADMLSQMVSIFAMPGDMPRKEFEKHIAAALRSAYERGRSEGRSEGFVEALDRAETLAVLNSFPPEDDANKIAAEIRKLRGQG